MVLVSEWLPNPDGKDDGGEWFELRNTGERAVNLGGWRFSAGPKSAALSGAIPAGAYRVFQAKPLGLSFRNENGGVELIAPDGGLDKAEFTGSAPSGKSFARTGERFRFAEPSPGAPNPEAAIVEASYPLGVPLALSPGGGVVGGALIVGCAAVLATGYIIHQIHDLHDLLFERHQAVGGPPGADAA